MQTGGGGTQQGREKEKGDDERRAGWTWQQWHGRTVGAARRRVVGGGKTVSLAAGDHFTRKRCPGSLPFVFKEEARRNVKPERSATELSRIQPRVSRSVAKEECQFAESPLRGGERPRVPCVGMEILKRAGWNSGRDIPRSPQNDRRFRHVRRTPPPPGTGFVKKQPFHVENAPRRMISSREKSAASL